MIETHALAAELARAVAERHIVSPPSTRAAAFDLAAAYAVGFMVPFAPAGLGIRDAILTLGLLPFAATGEALAITVLARGVYLLVDVGLVVVQEPLFSLFGKATRYSDG